MQMHEALAKGKSLRPLQHKHSETTHQPFNKSSSPPEEAVEDPPPLVPPRKESLFADRVPSPKRRPQVPPKPSAPKPVIQTHTTHTTTIEVSKLTSAEVGQCLTKLDMGKYVKIFALNQVNGPMLMALQGRDLKVMGMSLDEAKKVLTFIRTGVIH